MDARWSFLYRDARGLRTRMPWASFSTPTQTGGVSLAPLRGCIRYSPDTRAHVLAFPYARRHISRATFVGRTDAGAMLLVGSAATFAVAYVCSTRAALRSLLDAFSLCAGAFYWPAIVTFAVTHHHTLVVHPL